MQPKHKTLFFFFVMYVPGRLCVICRILLDKLVLFSECLNLEGVAVKVLWVIHKLVPCKQNVFLINFTIMYLNIAHR